MKVKLVEFKQKVHDGNFPIWIVLLRVEQYLIGRRNPPPLYYASWTSKLASVEFSFIERSDHYFSSVAKARKSGLQSLTKANDRFWKLLQTPIKFVRHEL